MAPKPDQATVKNRRANRKKVTPERMTIQAPASENTVLVLHPGQEASPNSVANQKGSGA